MTSSDNETRRLRATDPPLLAMDEALCPKCRLAYFVSSQAHDWGCCSECLGEALVKPFD